MGSFGAVQWKCLHLGLLDERKADVDLYILNVIFLEAFSSIHEIAVGDCLCKSDVNFVLRYNLTQPP